MDAETKAFWRSIAARTPMVPGHGAAERDAAAQKDRELVSEIFALRQEVEDLRDRLGFGDGLEELDQKLGAYQREAEKMQAQRKKVRSIRDRIMAHVDSKVVEIDAGTI